MCADSGEKWDEVARKCLLEGGSALFREKWREDSNWQILKLRTGTLSLVILLYKEEDGRWLLLRPC